MSKDGLSLLSCVSFFLLLFNEYHTFLPFSSTPYLLLLGWISLKIRKKGFQQIGLAISWTLAAFGEELLYRGYFMNRIADLLEGSRFIMEKSILCIP